MEKVTRSYHKLLKTKKDGKAATKDQKNCKKSDKEGFFTGFKKKKRNIASSRGVQKITSKHLTVRTKALGNAVRSVFAVKEQVLSYEDDTNALINEDLFKLIDLGNRESPNNETSAIFPCSFQPINEESNKSIFREIEQKFKAFSPALEPGNDFYLVSKENLKQLVANKYVKHKNLILNSWAKTFQNFLFHFGIDYLPDLLTKIVSNQNKINRTAALFEIKTKFKGVPLAETFLRRKFVRRCNSLTNSQNLGAEIIMSNQAIDLIARAELEPSGSVDNSGIDPNLLKTPEKNPPTDNVFPVLSYRTPDNQKFIVNDVSVGGSTFRPAIWEHNTNKYIELDKRICSDISFVRRNGITERERNYFLAAAIKAEKQEDQNEDTVFGRPKKPQTCRKRTECPYIEDSSLLIPTPYFSTPKRKLNFELSFSKEKDKNIDFRLLQDVGKLHLSPVVIRRLFGDKEPRKSDQSTPKRGLESILSPDELSLRKKLENNGENIYACAKKFAAAPDDLGPIPKAKDTPPFEYKPHFQR